MFMEHSRIRHTSMPSLVYACSTYSPIPQQRTCMLDRIRYPILNGMAWLVLEYIPEANWSSCNWVGGLRLELV